MTSRNIHALLVWDAAQHRKTSIARSGEGGKVLKKSSGKGPYVLRTDTREYLRDGPPVFTPANLVALRRHLNETQRDFGKHFGVSRQTVANWEGTVRKPHPSQLKVFAKLATRITNTATAGPTSVRKTDQLTVAEAAAYLHVAEKTTATQSRMAVWRTCATRCPVRGRRMGGTS